MPLVLHGRHIGVAASKNGKVRNQFKGTSGQSFKIKITKIITLTFFKQEAVTFEFN